VERLAEPSELAPPELTADPLPDFLAAQGLCGGGPARRVNFTAVGYRWRLYYRYLGDGGIAFPDAKQEQRFNSLSDQERTLFAAKLRSLVDAANLGRIRGQMRQQRFHAGMRLIAASMPAVRSIPQMRCNYRPQARGTVRRRVAVRRTCGSRASPSRPRKPADKPLDRPCPLRGPFWLELA
jgi:hypothetical protein